MLVVSQRNANLHSAFAHTSQVSTNDPAVFLVCDSLTYGVAVRQIIPHQVTTGIAAAAAVAVMQNVVDVVASRR